MLIAAWCPRCRVVHHHPWPEPPFHLDLVISSPATCRYVTPGPDCPERYWLAVDPTPKGRAHARRQIKMFIEYATAEAVDALPRTLAAAPPGRPG
jgi:hypothetical protein